MLPYSFFHFGKVLKKVSIDMFMQFRNMTKSYFPDVNIAADKYQVIRQDNWRIKKFDNLKKFNLLRLSKFFSPHI
ncbi:transposase [Leptotrichia hongkongensis]|uniref:transposase n=1 Tax=Leptotrichia hongkongensis TaxID=554406 RepID=UPI0035A8C456